MLCNENCLKVNEFVQKSFRIVNKTFFQLMHDDPLEYESGSSFFRYFYIGISVQLLVYLEKFTFKFI